MSSSNYADDDDLSTGVNNKFPCLHCNRLYAKNILKAHEAKCVSSRTCPWCKIVFKNRGNLASHTKHLHQNREIRNTPDEEISCDVCNETFVSALQLKFHIRRDHYNLKTKIALRDTKKINQVWFEKVLNSNVIVEMSKTKHNILLIKKYKKDAGDIDIDENYSDIDLSNIYPLQSTRIICEICNKSILQKSYKKHVDEKHESSRKHNCSNCNRSFNRLYFYVKHVCSKIKRNRRKIIINKVESLHPMQL